MEKLKVLCLLIILLFNLKVVGQSTLNPNVGDTIVLKSYCKVIKKGKLLNEVTTTVEKNPIPEKFLETLEPNVKFIINSIGKEEVDLVAVDYKKLSSKTLKALQDAKPGIFEKSEWYNGKIYTISREEFDKSARAKAKAEERVNVGLLTLPFKARPQDEFSYDTEFNLNTTLSFKLTNLWGAGVNAQVGAGIGSVSLNNVNAAGLAEDEAQDVAVLTFLGGLMIQYNKVQAGLYIGVDQINNQAKYNWESNGNIWFGFGIGFNVFKISVGEKANNEQRKL